MPGSDNILGTDDGIIIGSTTLVAAYRNKIGTDEVTDTVTIYGSFYGSNEGKLVGLLFG